jgi:hypothetical protein
MTEREWVKTLVSGMEDFLREKADNIRVTEGFRLPYSSEIKMYSGKRPSVFNQIGYETDILIFEQVDSDNWKPRIIIETKINRVSTHDAITYSQKAQTHKIVHPYLRYGILIGNRNHHSLPGRLFRHGHHFDFMQSWKDFSADDNEWIELMGILENEIAASKTLEEILFNSRSRTRDKYTMLHRPLVLKE